MMCVKVMIVLMIPYCWRMSKPTRKGVSHAGKKLFQLLMRSEACQSASEPSQPSSRSVACQTDNTKQLEHRFQLALKTLETLVSQMQQPRELTLSSKKLVTTSGENLHTRRELCRGNLPFLEELKLRQAKMRS